MIIVLSRKRLLNYGKFEYAPNSNMLPIWICSQSGYAPNPVVLCQTSFERPTSPVYGTGNPCGCPAGAASSQLLPPPAARLHMKLDKAVGPDLSRPAPIYREGNPPTNDFFALCAVPPQKLTSILVPVRFPMKLQNFM
jgi:hypothetical protein